MDDEDTREILAWIVAFVFPKWHREFRSSHITAEKQFPLAMIVIRIRNSVLVLSHPSARLPPSSHPLPILPLIQPRKASNMVDLHLSGRRSSDRRSTSLSTEDIPSTTAWEPDPSSETLFHNGTQEHSPTRGDRTLRYCCYGLHAFLVAIHIVLVGMLFTHPEHSFSVSINNTNATIALRVFLHGFYLIYTTVLVLLTQKLALSAVMVQRLKLTAVHDISGAWNGIGAAISALWQQIKVTSSPSALVLVFVYLSCISGLHIISTSVIQFEAFNNTVTSVVPSSLAWPSSPANFSTLDWGDISPLMTMWPLLSTAKGLSGSTLFDVPSSDYSYTGAVVDATTIQSECGLLSNVSVGTWNSTEQIYHVDVNGLGEICLPVQDLGECSIICVPYQPSG
ncbi:hypothetical protein J3R83DRAFT_9238 [Lanmaoa asiatica]|nr:hypothetical protein J3R83DRAFT_9238 [Lanmaoa asiatica]